MASQSFFLLWICQASDSRSPSLSGGYGCQRQSSRAGHSPPSPRWQHSRPARQADIGLLHHLFEVMVGSESLIECRRCLVAGFPVYAALRLVSHITPLLNLCPRAAALREWGGRGWFGPVSQESAGGDGSGHDGERGGTCVGAATPRRTGTAPGVPPPPARKPPFPFQKHPRWRREPTTHSRRVCFGTGCPGARRQPGRMAKTTSELQLCRQLYHLALLAKNNFDSCYLTRAMPVAWTDTEGSQVAFLSCFLSFHAFNPSSMLLSPGRRCCRLCPMCPSVAPGCPGPTAHHSAVSHTKLNSEL